MYVYMLVKIDTTVKEKVAKQLDESKLYLELANWRTIEKETVEAVKRILEHFDLGDEMESRVASVQQCYSGDTIYVH